MPCKKPLWESDFRMRPHGRQNYKCVLNIPRPRWSCSPTLSLPFGCGWDCGDEISLLWLGLWQRQKDCAGVIKVSNQLLWVNQKGRLFWAAEFKGPSLNEGRDLEPEKNSAAWPWRGKRPRCESLMEETICKDLREATSSWGWPQADSYQDHKELNSANNLSDLRSGSLPSWAFRWGCGWS